MASMPGEADGPDQATVDQINSAVNQGYNYADVVAYHADNGLPSPPQPSLDAIMAGNTSDASTWVSQGSDPTKLDTAEQVAPLINQIAESGFGIGAVEGVGMRAARLGVETTTEGLTGAMTPVDLAVERAASTVGDVAAKAKISLAIGAAAEAAYGNIGGNRTGTDLGRETARRPASPERSL